MLEVRSPYDDSLIKTLPLATVAEVDRALATAHATFGNTAAHLAAHERLAVLERLAQLMEAHKEELTQLALAEGGKPYNDSWVEVERAINGVKLGIRAFSENSGKEIPMGLTPSSVSRTAFTTREPIGVVVSLSAFNHPLNLIVHQTVPAIVAGCPVVVKPASNTPLSCLRFVELLYEAGLPANWCQAVVCANPLAEKLATAPGVGYLSFIGSAKVGWYLRSKLAPGTRCGLEHGGAAPVIVDRSANIDAMIPSLVKGAFYHSGQVCVSVQRVFIDELVFDEVKSALVRAASRLAVGDPASKQSDMGPLILPREVERVAAWVAEARSSGAEIVLGGERLSKTTYAPTVIVDPKPELKVSSEEIFGPAVCLYRVKSMDEAVERANSLPYAFQAAVYATDIDVALGCARRLNATAVMVNDHSAFRVDWMPFGGREHSGLGLGGIGYSVHEMSREKLTVIKHGR